MLVLFTLKTASIAEDLQDYDEIGVKLLTLKRDHASKSFGFGIRAVSSENGLNPSMHIVSKIIPDSAADGYLTVGSVIRTVNKETVANMSRTELIDQIKQFDGLELELEIWTEDMLQTYLDKIQ